MITTDRRIQTIGEIFLTMPKNLRSFGFLSSLRCALHTFQSLAFRLHSRRKRSSSVPVHEKTPSVTLLTFTVYPDLVRVWYKAAEKYLNPSLQLMIVDCSGQLQARHFPLAKVKPFWNFSHARKIDYFIRHEIETPYVWLCDDDLFLIDPQALEKALQMLKSVENAAAVSLAPRGWSIPIGDQNYRGLGSYCVLFDRRIYIREGLSFSPVHTQKAEIGRLTGYYDTGDYANEQLIRLGYRTEILEPADGFYFVAGFVGTSIGRLALLPGLENFKQHIQELAHGNPDQVKMAIHTLGGAYCACKTAHLYRLAFHEEPHWTPPTSEKDLAQIAMNCLEPQAKTDVLYSFEQRNSRSTELERLLV